MKTRILTVIALITIGSLASCGGDDEPAPPPHIAGEWGLDSYIFANLPSTFSNNEGRVLLIGDITFNGISYDSYTLNILADGTYSIKIELPGPNITDTGKWTLNEETLTLDSDEFDTDIEYDVVRNENSQLWISQSAQFSLIEDAISDTLTQDYVNTLTDEEFNNLFTPVTLDLVYAFEK